MDTPLEHGRCWSLLIGRACRPISLRSYELLQGRGGRCKERIEISEETEHGPIRSTQTIYASGGLHSIFDVDGEQAYVQAEMLGTPTWIGLPCDQRP